jgi:hypothetical protein
MKKYILILTPANIKPNFVGWTGIGFKHIDATGLTTDECLAQIREAMFYQQNSVVSGNFPDLEPYYEFVADHNMRFIIMEEANSQQ